jgi:hypothetical protein
LLAGFALAHVLDQDTENFHHQWAAMNASFKQGKTPGNDREAGIRNFHKTLDEYNGQLNKSA